MLRFLTGECVDGSIVNCNGVYSERRAALGQGWGEWIWGESGEGLRMIKPQAQQLGEREAGGGYMQKLRRKGRCRQEGKSLSCPWCLPVSKLKQNDSNFLHCLVSYKWICIYIRNNMFDKSLIHRFKMFPTYFGRVTIWYKWYVWWW